MRVVVRVGLACVLSAGVASARPPGRVIDKKSAQPPSSLAEVEAARGDAWTVAGRCGEAIAAYRKSLAAAPEAGMVKVRLAHCLDVTGQRAEAKALLDALVDAAPPVGPAALAERGDRALAAGDVAGAIAAYEKLVARAPAQVEAKLALLEALRAQVERDPSAAGVKERAIELARRILKDARADQPTRERAEEIETLLRYGAVAGEVTEARARLALGDAKAAVPLLEKVVAAQPAMEEAVYLLGLAYAAPDVNRRNDARAAWRRAAHVKEAHYQLGLDAYETGDLEEAERRFAGAVELDGRYQAALYQLGLVMREAGKSAEAKRAWSRAVACDPKSELGRWAATKLALLTGQVNALAEGQVIDPSSEIGIGQVIASRISDQFGRFEEGGLEARLNAILKKLAQVSDRPERELRYRVVLVDVPMVNALTLPGGTVLVFRGLRDLVKQHLGDTDDAWAAILGHECAHAALRHGMGMIQVASSLASGGKALDSMGELAGLLNTVSRAHEFEADQFGTLYAYRAGYNPGATLTLHEKMMVANGDIPRGMTHPTHRERIERTRDYLLDLRGKVRGFDQAVRLLEAGDYDGAAQRLEVFLGVFPDSTSARSNLGVALHRKALTALPPATRFRRATDVDPNSRARRIELRAGVGEVAGLKPAAKIDERLLRAAVAEYEGALAVDAGYARALVNLGAALDDLRDKKQARAVLERAVRLAPASKEAWNNLGAVAADMGDGARALEALKKAVDLDGGYGEAWFNLALVYEQAERKREAAQAWDRYLAIDGKSGWAEVARAARAKLTAAMAPASEGMR
jgi:predicted Zn-dependent protease